MELNIADMCAAIAQAYPDRDALLFRDRRLCWAQVDARAAAFAETLHGVRPGRRRVFEGANGWESTQEHVALYLHNGNEYLEAMLGAWQASWAPVNINYRYLAAELTYVLADSRARVLVFHSAFAPLVQEVRAGLEHLEALIQVADESSNDLVDGARWYEDVVTQPASEALRARLADERSGDDLYVCYTGGTTGLPKGVLWRQADFVVSALGLRRKDRTDFDSIDEIVAAAEHSRLRALPAPPLMHGAAHWNALSCWLGGGTVIIQDHPEHFDAADVLDCVERHRVTSLLIVGDSFARPLLDQLEASRRAGRPRDMSSLRHLLSGGAVLSPHVKAELLGALDGVTIVDVLGSSESGRQAVATSAVASSAAAPGPSPAGPSPAGPPPAGPSATGPSTTGFRSESTAVVLADGLDRPLNADDPADVGVAGWLAQTGRMPLGYLGDEAKTAATFPVIGGVRHGVAGDRAALRTDGTIELLGRDSVCINTGGEKVFAEEVEVALTAHRAVTDAIVCGRASERWGSEVVAVVSLRPDATVSDDELIAHVKARLASYKAPKSIVRVAGVRRSPSGKPDYAWARSLAEG
ncbi:MAG: AMP-binding protein [Microthrixaceae bacterium]|nr:AMP-binding protein [Microthrixaceae bacterium]